MRTILLLWVIYHSKKKKKWEKKTINSDSNFNRFNWILIVTIYENVFKIKLSKEIIIKIIFFSFKNQIHLQNNSVSHV